MIGAAMREGAGSWPWLWLSLQPGLSLERGWRVPRVQEEDGLPGPGSWLTFCPSS